MMGERSSGDTIRDLGGRLIDETKAYAKAEIDVVRETGLVYLRAGRTAAISGIAALVLLLAALPVLIAGLGMVLALWIGVAGGLIAASALFIVIAGLLAWRAARALGGIAETLG